METIEETFINTIQEANNASNWYKVNIKAKRKYSRGIRLTSIILFGLGGIIPLINALILENKGETTILNLGYIAIAFAGTLLLLDKFFGFSSGWIRYITTEMEITKKIKEFELRWKIETYGKNLAVIPEEEAKELLSMLADFIIMIKEIVKEETSAWALEFQTNMAELQKSINNKIETTIPGSIKVTLSNISDYKNLKIKLNNMGSLDVKRKIYFFQGVPPGYHVISLIGENIATNQLFESAEVVLAEAGKLTEFTMNLED
ncbi:SLATT domain-containing protein [Algoriphagus aquimarinus]|uniref:SLATT domain-containing protein n=1 Tax=Algoriphagus aquimarinus TaxID=237018 RepID=A0A5C7AEL4_9BACT|nr:SLATT domain-containing protein [Algoriphagus aquimarinus]TXE06717.1 SLATT domain-containing protein [Algoriphagus aquimarinus]